VSVFIDPIIRAIRDELSNLIGANRSSDEMLAILAENAFVPETSTASLAGLTTLALSREVKAGRFPQPIVLEPSRLKVWSLAEIKIWQKAHLDARIVNIDLDQLVREIHAGGPAVTPMPHPETVVPQETPHLKRARQREAA
jgi:predicted DNA-binding transcriptional regulator AlpA